MPSSLSSSSAPFIYPTGLKRNIVIVVLVVLLHGALIIALAKAKEQIKPPEIIPITLLGSFVPRQEEQAPAVEAAAVVEEVAPPTPVVPEPPKPEPPKPELPKPELPKPRPEPPKPKPEPMPEPEVEPVVEQQEVAPVTAKAEQSAEPRESSKPATQGNPDGAEEVTPAVYNAQHLRNPKPPYPPMSTRLREEGVVTLRVLITAEGKARRVEVKRSSGYPRLDESARKTVHNRWNFIPAKRGNTPIEQWRDVPVRFSLESR